MTEQEKELGIYIAECVNGLPDSGDNFKDCFTLAKAIIEKYPQMTKKPVKVSLFDRSESYSFRYIITTSNEEMFSNNIKLFKTPEQRQEWIDSHYVEVIS